MSHPRIKTAARLLAKIGLGTFIVSAFLGILYLIGLCGLFIISLIFPLPEDMPPYHPISAFMGLVFMAYATVIVTTVGYVIIKLGSGALNLLTGKEPWW